MAPLLLLSIQFLLLHGLGVIGTQTAENIQTLSLIITGLFFAFAFPVVLRRRLKLAIGSYVLFALLFSAGYLFFPNNRPVIVSLLFSFFVVCLPCFIYAASIHDREKLVNVSAMVGYVVVVSGVVLLFMRLTNRAFLVAYAMSIGYYLLIPCLFFLQKVLAKFSLRYAFLFALTLLMIVLMGSRGPLLCFAVYLSLSLWHSYRRLSRQRLTGIVALISIGGYLVVSFDSMLLRLDLALGVIGIGSRTIGLFLRDGIHLSGRGELYSVMLSAIRDNPLFGIGLGGDRVILGTYAHNLLLEVLAAFGLPLGGAILLSLAYLIVRSISARDESAVLAMWTTAGVVPLLVSMSIFTFYPFWICLGLYFSYLANCAARATLSGSRSMLADSDGYKGSPQIGPFEYFSY